jgi:hypothetical protein
MDALLVLVLKYPGKGVIHELSAKDKSQKFTPMQRTTRAIELSYLRWLHMIP